MYHLDGAANNVGIHNGAICLTEERLGQATQHKQCHYHMAELPIKHLIQHLDGNSSDPGCGQMVN